MKIQKTFFFRGGGGSGWGVRIDLNREESFCENSKKNWRVGEGGGGQGGCERRIEVFVKIQKQNWGGVGSGWGRIRMDVNEELTFL